MQRIDRYLLKRALYPKLLNSNPAGFIDYIMVIPCFNEDYKTLEPVLESIEAAANAYGSPIELLLVFNHYKDVSKDVIKVNENTQSKVRLRNKHDFVHIKILDIAFPSFKLGGVGYARKVGMDEALRRFNYLKKPDGVILCMDADTLISEHYFISIAPFVKSEKWACSFHFEHPVQKESIIKYELHLRYFINMQRLFRLPYAFQTVGSAMGVKALAYALEGGMNKRQAGEDFYFLQKFISKGRIYEIMDARVIPSDRVSDRVPFGTGKAVGEIEAKPEDYGSYHPTSFEALSIIPLLLQQVYEKQNWKEQNLNPFVEFLVAENADEIFNKLRSQSRDKLDFTTKFFSWFNAFKLFKYLHFTRDIHYPNIVMEECCKYLFNKIGLDYSDNLKDNLCVLREYDKKMNYGDNFNQELM